MGLERSVALGLIDQRLIERKEWREKTRNEGDVYVSNGAAIKT